MPVTSPRASAMIEGYRRVPLVHTNEEEHRREMALILNNLLDGKINAKGSVTLSASLTSTTLADFRIGAASVILFMPTTANAATAMTSLFVSSRGDQTATLTHNSDAATDRTFAYTILG